MLTCSISAVSTSADPHVRTTVYVANYVSFSHGVVEGKFYGLLALRGLTHRGTYQSHFFKAHVQDCQRLDRKDDLVGHRLQLVRNRECLPLGPSLTKD
jgi:hypothetical protein